MVITCAAWLVAITRYGVRADDGRHMGLARFEQSIAGRGNPDGVRKVLPVKIRSFRKVTDYKNYLPFPCCSTTRVVGKITKISEWQRNIKFRQRCCLFPSLLPNGRKAHRGRIYIGRALQEGFQLVLEVVIR